MKQQHKVNVIGGGLAGVEAAYYLAEKGVKVTLYDLKPNKMTPAHSDKNYAELVCSNSLKSNDIYSNACGLLKQEMRVLNSLTIKVADECKVPAGAALAVNREIFAEKITKIISSHKNIECVSKEITEIDLNSNTIIATGPLTTDALSEDIKKITGGSMFFYDAAAPIVSADSIDYEYTFIGDRYKNGEGDYLNCPIDKETYDIFIDELIKAEKTHKHSFEKNEFFNGCMPIEIMADRGRESLRFGPLKPRGLDDPKTGRWPYACLQMRKENLDGTMYNLVGFQTNLKFNEQKKVFSIIKALKNAEFLRYGVMHKNFYLNSPEVLNADYSLKSHPNIFFAGQITGVEGYVESASSGLISAINMYKKLNGSEALPLDNQTISGALTCHISVENSNFQPMNANYGILKPTSKRIRDKKLKKQTLSVRALVKINEIKDLI